jgi:predicted nucleic acid-binding protein
MHPVLFDSSVYISAMRLGKDAIPKLRQLASGSQIWLSAVVLHELYAGTADRGRQIIERMEAEFEKAHRIVVPSAIDWSEAGRVLARLAAKYHYEKIGRSRLSNDALIAVSAARLGMRVITENQRDFHRLSEFHPFHLEVAVL